MMKVILYIQSQIWGGGPSITHNSSSIVCADFSLGALSAVDYDDTSVAGSLQLLHVGIATSVRDITSSIRLKNDPLHRRLKEGPDLKRESDRERER
ncbi:MAG: hypothetical protein MJE68_32300, partial [Proteobacteria bacterium]|nr:hypothetical protein [Pseudomonadota bacterium]